MKIIDKYVIHRKYPDVNWEYKGMATKVNDNGIIREIIYFVANGIPSVEVYTGKNYIVGAKNKSYSNKYSMDNVPKKYESIVSQLKAAHENYEWSTEEYIDLN